MQQNKQNQDQKYGVAPETLCAEIRALEKAARRYTVNRFEAEDLVQDTLVLALRFRNSYRSGTNLRAWLMTVMRNRQISIARRRRLERRILDEEGRRSMNRWQTCAAAWTEQECETGPPREDQLSDDLLKAMNRLNPEFRQAVWLCDVEGLSYADAARVASCPVGTIMSRLHRGRSALRSKLGSRRRLEAA